MLATFAFDVCHDVYRAAREVIDLKIPTLNAEASGKYQWRPDRMPRLAEYVCDFARLGERALGGSQKSISSSPSQDPLAAGPSPNRFNASPSAGHGGFRASRVAMFRVYYLGGAEYRAARRHLGISEFTWEDWAEEIRRLAGREFARAGLFPPSKYFRESSARAS
jgi:hypothetical protein